MPVLREVLQLFCGASPIAEYLDETRGPSLGSRRLMPGNPVERAEVRRLMTWFNLKFYEEVGNLLLHEKVTKRFLTGAQAAPEMSVIRAAKK